MKSTVTNLNRESLLKVHHEIRTPLNIFLGFIQILQFNTKLTEREKRQYIKLLEQESYRLINRIDDIMVAFEQLTDTSGEHVQIGE